MSGNAPMLTDEQRLITDFRGGPLLVSAAAGSGKTKVLVERLLGYITDPHEACNIDEFLVITFTRAAADELKGRIREEITERLSTDKSNRHLRRQLSLVMNAQISTIHSFCEKILRENTHIAGLAPGFRVADESECADIRLAVLDRALTKAYETIASNKAFEALVDAVSSGRDDSQLSNLILETHRKIQCHPDPKKWADANADMLKLEDVDDISQCVWGRYIMEDASRAAQYWESAMRDALNEMEALPDLKKAYGASFSATAAGIGAFISALEMSWDEARLLRDIDFPAGRISGYEDIKLIRTSCKKAMAKIAETFKLTSQELIDDMRQTAPCVIALIGLVFEFDEAYSAEKRERGIIDFSDQEHMALKVLTDAETGAESPAARAWAKKYKEIMVDEYQDVNEVQERIFNLVSNAGKNIFMVGDVKQSIYRFRLADPTIFLRKYEAFTDLESGGAAPPNGKKAVLSKNFRSGQGIIEAVNFVFSNIMTADAGEMDYSQKDFLYRGRQEPGGDCAVEVDVIDLKSDGDEEDGESPQKTEREARFIASRIAELMNSGFTVPDGNGGHRPPRFSDIAILLRSYRGKAWQYAKALDEAGIPVETGEDEAFFDALEISIAMSLLEVIDNPFSDIPLISVLRSPLYGFSPDELAEIRAADRESDFYTALKKAAASSEKCTAFLKELDGFRELAPDLSTDGLIWLVFNKTGMRGIVGAMKNGRRRRENLTRIIDCAKRFERNGHKGLYRFLSYMRGMRDRGESPPGEDAGHQESDGVRILSVHKSKGLEFPVVFLADTSKRINRTDLSGNLLIHSELCVGMKRRDLERQIRYTTVAREAIKLKMEKELIAEELRVLYVAMTRAREKLIIVATYGDAEKELENLSQTARRAVPAELLRRKPSIASWILIPALTRPEARALFEETDKSDLRGPELWDFNLIKTISEAGKIAGLPPADESEKRAAADPATAENLIARLSYSYPHPIAVQLPSKLTASELKGRSLDREIFEDSEKSLLEQSSVYERPEFVIKDSKLTGAEKGTALHLVMQYIDFKKCESADGISEELKRLTEREFITPEQAEAAEPEKIAAFFQTPLGRELLSADSIEREFKFSILVRAEDYFPGGGEYEILLQGIIDCFFEKNGRLYIIDFKTDYVTEATVSEHIKLYENQIMTYSRALEEITGRTPAARYLYFFRLDKAVEIS